jgi:uncharacterized MAPEG superfamily protein
MEEEKQKPASIMAMVGNAVIPIMGIAVSVVAGMAQLKPIEILVIVALMTGLMWMPYVMARIFFNTEKGKPMSGLYIAMAFLPQTAELPPWVKRSEVAHSNAIENLVLFAPAVLCAKSMNVPDNDIFLPCFIYFVARVFHWVFNLAPLHWKRPIFALRTGMFMLGWGCCTAIFVICMAKSRA